MALDFQQDGVHLVYVDHGLEDLVYVAQVELDFLVQEVTVQIVGSVGWNVLEIVLGQELLCKGDFSVVKKGFLEQCLGSEKFISDMFHAFNLRIYNYYMRLHLYTILIRIFKNKYFNLICDF